MRFRGDRLGSGHGNHVESGEAKMKITYRCNGIDRETGKPRSEVVDAATHEGAIGAANGIGMMVDDVVRVSRPPKPRHGAYEVLFAIAKTLAIFGAIAVLLFGLQVANSAIQETTVIAFGCFCLILARLFQAEEHSRK